MRVGRGRDAKRAKKPVDASIAAWQHSPIEIRPKSVSDFEMTTTFNRLPTQAHCALGSRMPWDAEGRIAKVRPHSGRTTE